MKIKFKQYVAMHSIATQIRRICAIAIVAIIGVSFITCDDSLGEDEASFTLPMKNSTSARISNSNRYNAVTVTIGSNTKTISAYSGSGAYPHVTFNSVSFNGTSVRVKYSPKSLKAMKNDHDATFY